MNWPQFFFAVALVGICSLLIIVILLQRGRGGGLSSAFGGGGGSSAFGAKTGDVFTWITVVMAAVFLVLSVVGTYVFDESRRAKAGPVIPVETDVGGLLPISGAPIDGDLLPGTVAGQPVRVPIEVDAEGNIKMLAPDDAGSAPSEAEPSPTSGAAPSEPSEDKPGADKPADPPETP